jgi:RNA polymerase sigma factor (sigma-70 family)
MDFPPDGDLMRDLGGSSDMATKARALDRLRQRFEAEMLATAEAMLRGQLVHGLEAQDVVHELFAELLLTAKAKRFDRTRPLRPWLMTVVRNKARDLLRGEKKHVDLTDRTLPRSAEAVQQHTAAHQEVEELFSLLTPDERRLCERFYLEDVSAAEIAHDLAVATAQVYRGLDRIRTKLRISRLSC